MGVMSKSLPSVTGGHTPLFTGLVIVMIVLQLYLITLWINPSTPKEHALATTCTDGSKSDSSTTELTDSKSAMTSLMMLRNFIKQNQDKFDAAEQEELIKLDLGDKKSDKPHQPELPGHPDEEGLVVVGKGVDVDTHDHGKKDHSGHNHKQDGSAKHEHHAGDTHDEAFLKEHKNLYQDIWLDASATWAEDILNPEHFHKLPEAERQRIEGCRSLQERGNVVPYENWGTLNYQEQQQYDQLKCSDWVSVTETAKYIKANPDMYNHKMMPPADRDIPIPEPGYEDKVIATIVPMTTRTLTINNFVNDLALFRNLLPSWLRTIETGFEYWFYIGYDNGDPFLDNAANLKAMRAWWDEHIAPAAKNRGITVKLMFASFENKWRKPGPAFNYLCAVAYEDGATFLYRINDDQNFETPWAKAMTDALLEMGAPYGAVGPQCGQGATHILVVEMTHRTHHEIFTTHYPPSVMAWFLDNWVTNVYGSRRTKRVNSVRITHLTEAHRTRYEVNGSSKYWVGEVVRGRAMVEEYMSHTPGMQEQLKAYRSDNFNFNI